MTGLQKGAIYNHFSSKDDLAVAAFEYAVTLETRGLRNAMMRETHAVDKLLALVKAFGELAKRPPYRVVARFSTPLPRATTPIPFCVRRLWRFSMPGERSSAMSSQQALSRRRSNLG